MIGFDGGASDGLVDESRKEVSSEPPRRRFELGVLGVLTNVALLLLATGREPVEVVLLGQKLFLPKTALNMPQPDFFSGDSPIFFLLLFMSLSSP